MTAIAIRNGVMAVDSLSQRDGLFSGHVKKFVSVNGNHVAGAGRFSTLRRFFDWARDGLDFDNLPEIADDDDTQIFVLHHDGKVSIISNTGVDDADDAFVATGEFRFLYGAMAVGASACDAVMAACNYSVDCGSPVWVLRAGKDEASAFHDEDCFVEGDPD